VAWGLVQGASGTTGVSASTFGVAFATSNIVANNRILVAIAIWNASATTITSVTDSAGNTYNGPVARAAVSDNTDVTLWDAVITAGAGTKPTVTGHASAATLEWAIVIREFSGLSTATSGYLDGVNHNTGATGNATSSASTPAPGASNELAVGVYGDGGNNDGVTAGSGWANLLFSGAASTTAESAQETQNSTSGTGSTATFTLSPSGSPWGCLVAIYQLAAAGGGVAVPPIYGYGPN
jgi:hypothetical protein